MAHIGGRTVKNVEAPRPLKSQSRSSLKNNYMLIEELIQLIENVAHTLQSGYNNTEPMAMLVQNLRVHGPQLETFSKDTLDRAFVVFRNASQDERLNIMTRLNLLELIELRAKGWEDHGFNSYYKSKQPTNVDLPDGQHHVDPTQMTFLSTSPTFGGAGGSAAAAAAVIAAVGSAQQTQLLLGPGEIIRNSGKFPKPTKIPGKTYCKDEVVIRNADSGKVMGIKGRRVHMIEELSETIISFQRVNPGAKERLVQITGPSEEKINYAKQLIEDTIRRNASPVRLESAAGAAAQTVGAGSCSSLASSNSDELVTPRTPGGSNLANRLSFNSAQNFMTAAAAAQQMSVTQQQVANMMGVNATNAVASAGEYKYTVNVGQHLIKITGDCCDLVRVAKLVLDDYFSSAEFLASVEAGAAFDGSIVSPITTPTTPMGAPQFMMGTPLHAAQSLATDSGIGLNYMAAGQIPNSTHDVDDEVFADAKSQSNGLARSRRSHFSRKDSTPEAMANALAARNKPDGATTGSNNTESGRIVHEYEHLLYYAKSPHAWALPVEWQKICDKFPAIIRNKVTHTTPPYNAKTAPLFRIASTSTTTTTTTTTTATTTTTTTTTEITASTATAALNSNHSSLNTVHNVNSSLSLNAGLPNFINNAALRSSLQLNIKRKGFFSRQTYSIDEEGYASMQQQQQQEQQPQQQQPQIKSELIATNNNNNILSNTFNKSSSYGSNFSRTGLTSGALIAGNVNPIVGNVNSNNNGHNRQLLLDKQIKIISAIMEGRNARGELIEKDQNKVNGANDAVLSAVGTSAIDIEQSIYVVDDDDDDDTVEFVGESKLSPTNDNTLKANIPRPTVARAHSTCD